MLTTNSTFENSSNEYFKQLLDFAKEYQKNNKLSCSSQEAYSLVISDFRKSILMFIFKTENDIALEASIFNRMQIFQEIVLEDILRNNNISTGIETYVLLQNRSMAYLRELNRITEIELIWHHSILLTLTILHNCK